MDDRGSISTADKQTWDIDQINQFVAQSVLLGMFVTLLTRECPRPGTGVETQGNMHVTQAQRVTEMSITMTTKGDKGIGRF